MVIKVTRWTTTVPSTGVGENRKHYFNDNFHYFNRNCTLHVGEYFSCVCKLHYFTLILNNSPVIRRNLPKSTCSLKMNVYRFDTFKCIFSPFFPIVCRAYLEHGPASPRPIYVAYAHERKPTINSRITTDKSRALLLCMCVLADHHKKERKSPKVEQKFIQSGRAHKTASCKHNKCGSGCFFFWFSGQRYWLCIPTHHSFM